MLRLRRCFTFCFEVEDNLRRSLNMNDLRFEFVPDENTFEGELNYIDSEYSIAFRPTGALSNAARYSSLSSIVFGTLELFFDIGRKQAMYFSGYFPNTSWKERQLPSFSPSKGSVFAKDDVDFKQGVAIDWEKYIDSTTGWLYFGPSSFAKDSNYVEFATGSVLEFSPETRICALWLIPTLVIDIESSAASSPSMLG